MCNLAGAPTCIRPQGASVVDLTWCSLNANNCVDGWTIQDKETLSNHVYVTFDYCAVSDLSFDPIAVKYPRWCKRNFDLDIFSSTLDLQLSCFSVDRPINDIAKWIVNAMTDACDLASTQYLARSPRKKVYWWCDAVMIARSACIRARRKVRRRGVILNREVAEKDYRQAKQTLRLEIKKAKARAWQTLINSVDRNPWGLPFKLVLNKLRRPFPRLSETLDLGSLNRLLDSLFPGGDRKSVV